MSRQFEVVKPAKVGYSAFDLSHDKKFTCDMGELIPILVEEALPGDVWMIGNQGVIRAQPLVGPIMHEVNVFFHYFFVPIRQLWSSWETFITGGQLGTDATALPKWNPSSTAEGSLWDYMGFPTGVNPDADNDPLDFPKRAYNHIYNEYYRDENLITAVAIDTSETLKIRAWEKDFFTSALPWLQRGTAPALPVSIGGSSAAVWAAGFTIEWPAISAASSGTMAQNTSSQVPYDTNTKTTLEKGTATKAKLDANTVAGSGFTATSFSINDLRLALQLQKWMERNARAGYRYIEEIVAHFGNVAPKDERLQRPEYIGGSKAPIVVSEVLQTSATGLTGGSTPQGNLAGHGIGVVNQLAAKYRCKEHGIIMGIMSIMPRTVYQQGIDKMWSKATRYDYYWPEFANLGEQAILRKELYADTVKANNETVFGYIGRYDEYRQRRSMVCGELRSTLDHWHISRQFGSAPTLNQTFIECVPRKDIFAAPSQDGWVCNIGNIVKAIRPMPFQAEPGISM